MIHDFHTFDKLKAALTVFIWLSLENESIFSLCFSQPASTHTFLQASLSGGLCYSNAASLPCNSWNSFQNISKTLALFR
jgi:hypothetical protein